MTKPNSNPRRTLKETEERILAIDPDDAGHDFSMRKSFGAPTGIFAEDVLVQREICLSRGKGHPDQKRLSWALADLCVSRLSSRYSAPSAKDAKLLLKVYVLDVHKGDPESRIIATENGRGHVRCTLAWILCTADGSVVLDAARYHETDTHFYGLGDVLRLADSERTLTNMTERMCQKILKRTNLPGRNEWSLCCCGCC